MTKLTEELIRQRLRNCSAPLDFIMRINITGRDLEDISLLRKMTGIEVLSLSVNKISTLYDLQFCKNLKELYLRRNNISNLNEIYYLRDLQFLVVLGMSQNPCSNESDYRMTVIKNLPKLEKLDDVSVMPEERVEAFKKGRKICPPREDETDTEESLNKTPSVVEFADKIVEKPLSQPNSDDPRKRLGFYESDKPAETDGLYCPANPRMQTPTSRFVSPCRYMEAPLPEVIHHDGVHRAEKPTVASTVNHSNTLAGILILMKDLDYQSLELLSLNVKGRLNEYQNSGCF